MTEFGGDVTIVFFSSRFDFNFFIKNSMSVHFFAPIFEVKDINSSTLGVIRLAGV